MWCQYTAGPSNSSPGQVDHDVLLHAPDPCQRKMDPIREGPLVEAVNHTTRINHSVQNCGFSVTSDDGSSVEPITADVLDVVGRCPILGLRGRIALQNAQQPGPSVVFFQGVCVCVCVVVVVVTYLVLDTPTSQPVHRLGSPLVSWVTRAASYLEVWANWVTPNGPWPQVPEKRLLVPDLGRVFVSSRWTILLYITRPPVSRCSRIFSINQTKLQDKESESKAASTQYRNSNNNSSKSNSKLHQVSLQHDQDALPTVCTNPSGPLLPWRGSLETRWSYRDSSRGGSHGSPSKHSIHLDELFLQDGSTYRRPRFFSFILCRHASGLERSNDPLRWFKSPGQSYALRREVGP